MASVLSTIGGAVKNAFLFSGTNFFFSELTDYGEKKHKRHDLAFKKPQKAKVEWNEDKME